MGVACFLRPFTCQMRTTITIVMASVAKATTTTAAVIAAMDEPLLVFPITVAAVLFGSELPLVVVVVVVAATTAVGGRRSDCATTAIIITTIAPPPVLSIIPQENPLKTLPRHPRHVSGAECLSGHVFRHHRDEDASARRDVSVPRQVAVQSQGENDAGRAVACLHQESIEVLERPRVMRHLLMDHAHKQPVEIPHEGVYGLAVLGVRGNRAIEQGELGQIREEWGVC